MKIIKTSIGNIAYLETNANKKDSEAKVPQGFRIGTAGELVDLYLEELKALRSFPKWSYILCKKLAWRLETFKFEYTTNGKDFDNNNDIIAGVFLVEVNK